MRVIRASNVNDAFKIACGMMTHEIHLFRKIAPREGKATYEFHEPVTTVYTRPWQRVLFSEVRDANPFFHLMEALWMLSGRRDAEWLGQFTSQMAQYAEVDGNFHGAYGYRWREHFQQDQITNVIAMLRENADSRRVVLGMWDPVADLRMAKKDLPCNTHAYFKVRESELHLTVCCRSNDLILGCYGANAVHFSILQEYVAAAIGARVGTYTQISDSWHFYEDNPLWKQLEGAGYVDHSAYYHPGMAYAQTRALALVNSTVDLWSRDLRTFMSDEWDSPDQYNDIFFRDVAYLARDSYACYKRGDLVTAISVASRIAAPDWRAACVQWLDRRERKRRMDKQKQLHSELAHADKAADAGEQP